MDTILVHSKNKDIQTKLGYFAFRLTKNKKIKLWNFLRSTRKIASSVFMELFGNLCGSQLSLESPTLS